MEKNRSGLFVYYRWLVLLLALFIASVGHGHRGI
jgi:hypothetical protein